eukprot:gene1037-1380_t
MLPDAPVAVQERDVQAALMAAQQRASTWGGDPNRFILMGHSAGAHLVALLNARAPQALREGAWPWLGAVSLDSAVMNVPAYMRAPHMPLYDDAFGSEPAYWVALSPFHQWTVGAPPMQMVCSTERADQPCTQADAMARHVRNQGGRAEVLPQDLTHGEINAQLGLESDYTRAVETFMGSLDTEMLRQIPPRVAGRVGRQFFGRAHAHHGAPARTTLRPHVDEPIGGFDHVQVVFDDDDGVARVAQLVQHLQQQVDVGKVQAGGGLVQDVERAARIARGGQIDEAARWKFGA